MRNGIKIDEDDDDVDEEIIQKVFVVQRRGECLALSAAALRLVMPNLGLLIFSKLY